MLILALPLKTVLNIKKIINGITSNEPIIEVKIKINILDIVISILLGIELFLLLSTSSGVNVFLQLHPIIKYLLIVNTCLPYIILL